MPKLTIEHLSTLECAFLPESMDKEWRQSYQMEKYPLTTFAVSMAPNGRDVWLSGGLGFQHEKVGHGERVTFPVRSKTNIVKYY